MEEKEELEGFMLCVDLGIKIMVAAFVVIAIIIAVSLRYLYRLPPS
mgnify:CR=1 FL=1